MPTLTEIEYLTRAFSRDQAELRGLVGALQAEVEDAKRRQMRAIRRAVERARNSRSLLQSAIDSSRDLFVRPRSVVIDGIKVGLQKRKGTLSFGDAERVCSLIRKHLPEMADALIVTESRPVKAALAALPVADLRRVGVSVTNDSDAVLIKDTAGDVEMLVDALLQEDESEH